MVEWFESLSKTCLKAAFESYWIPTTFQALGKVLKINNHLCKKFGQGFLAASEKEEKETFFYLTTC